MTPVPSHPWAFIGGGTKLHRVASAVWEVNCSWRGLGRACCGLGGVLEVPTDARSGEMPRCKRCERLAGGETDA